MTDGVPLSLVTALLALLLLCFPLAASAQVPSPGTVTVDFSRPAGRLRPLHGVNKGPLAAGGLVDVSAEQRALGIPFVRLHDCHWPNPDVVDIHAVFPDGSADPQKADSYDFRLTDEYIAAARTVGAEIIYRLGESIEHTSVRRFVHPPKDADRWAAIALGIIRHYNDGWADGHRYGIRYWEIWNEPENRPAMWSGTDDDYFRLYRTAARAIKAAYPSLKVGGPAVGDTGEVEGSRLKPSAFLVSFLDTCKREGLPLDFVSWHCYTDDPAELCIRAVGIRALLDERGFRSTESHLTEWNYLPDRDWSSMGRAASAKSRQRTYERMAGTEGAAFTAAALLRLQESPVDVACLFHGEVGIFGIFSEAGVPARNYYALLAFHELLRTPERVVTTVADAGRLTVCGCRVQNGRSAAVLVVNSGNAPCAADLRLSGLPWQGAAAYTVRLLDAGHDLAQVQQGGLAADGKLPLSLPGSSVILVALMPRTP